MVFECFSVESELNIKNTAVINDVNRYRSLKREEKAAFFYQGPEFEHLDNVEIKKIIENYNFNRDCKNLLETIF